MVLIFLIGVSIYVFEGCAGQGLQERWEECAQEIHQDCFEAEDVLDCGYQHYRKCIDGS